MMHFKAVPPSLFIRNRQKIRAMLQPHSAIVLYSGQAVIRTADQNYPFRPSSDFYYLTGERRPGAFFIFAPDHPEPELRECVLLPQPDSKQVLWNGPAISLEESRLLGGIVHQAWNLQQSAILEKVLDHSVHLYSDPATIQALALRAQQVAPFTEKARSIKSDEEIEQIQQAVDLTRSAFLRVLKKLRPGLMEYELEAEMIAEFIAKGAEGHAFDPILASGPNALILHYIRNRDQCRDGELLLMDFGAELNCYAADCSRTLPVNGRYSPRQRELYDACLNVFRAVSMEMKPGKVFSDLQEDTCRLWEEEHIRLGLYTYEEAKKHQGSNALWKKYFPHGVSHSMGLDVHDPFDRKQPLQPGMVLTCEPGIYIPEEGTGIRIENDILITVNGNEDLMKDFPVEAEEIEDLMNIR